MPEAAVLRWLQLAIGTCPTGFNIRLVPFFWVLPVRKGDEPKGEKDIRSSGNGGLKSESVGAFTVIDGTLPGTLDSQFGPVIR